MIPFVNNIKITNFVPKLVETEKSYILNNIYHDKETFAQEDIMDTIIYGKTNHISLNRMANMHSFTSGIQSYSIPCNNVSRIIKDINNEDIVYIFLEDYDTNNSSSYRYVYKYNERTKKVIDKNTYLYAKDGGLYMNMSKVISQDDKYIYMILNMCHTSYQKYNRDVLFKLDKNTLEGTTFHELGRNRYTYSLVKDNERFIYLIRRCANMPHELCEYDKITDNMNIIKAFEGYSDEDDRMSRQMDCVYDELTGKAYLIEMPTKKDNDDARWIEIPFKHGYPKPLTSNGQPVVYNLKKEVSYEIHGYNSLYNHSPCPLFTKNNHSAGYGSASTFHWGRAENYIDITFDDDVTIWRSGVGYHDKANNLNKLMIHKYNDEIEDWVNITDDIVQNVTLEITNTMWEKYIEELPAGRYKFSYDKGSRMDGGWYLESVNGKEYLTNETFGVFDLDDISVKEIKIETKDEATALPAFDLQKEISCTDYIITNGLVNKYIHQISFYPTIVGLQQQYREHAVINTYMIDEKNYRVVYTGSCPLSNNTEVCRSYVANESNTRIAGLSKANTFIHEFSEMDQKFVPKKYFPFISKTIGFDKKENIWILDDLNQLLKYNSLIPESVDIRFAEDIQRYTGEEISSYIKIKALNYAGDIVASNWTLTINGDAKFTETDSSVIDINTLEDDDLTVPITIFGAGTLAVYPVLNANIKN